MDRAELTFAICVALFCVAVVALSGCAAPADYWKQTREPYAVKEVIYVREPAVFCPRLNLPRLDGCTIMSNESKSAILYIKQDLPEWLRECTIKHERKHAAGYEHGNDAISDCYW